MNTVPITRLAGFVDALQHSGHTVREVKIDYTNPVGYEIIISWTKRYWTCHYVLVACAGLDGFSIYVNSEGELSEDDVVFEAERDSDITKV